ncbi:ADP-ribosylglycohydrolase family protein [Neiella marina]|uniref:ADP-ribosylglycohydrolase family protein n=1 Tax=Neiella holothuriorum TaxID=2870530 RepID=A0ABS7EEA5_9GAMM|nr:ADP-ribosylglycohydrolase family protein [Neiella holothuriorum]MBW8190651.1 ADP-ribosylglycohydrolase family protein [Neiella holothuriorum]
MTDYVGLDLKQNLLDEWGLPNQEYPLPLETIKADMGNNGWLPKELLLHGLQAHMSEKSAAYQDQHLAIKALCRLFYEPELATETQVEGDNWGVLYGDIDLAHDEIVTIQRNDQLLAALKQQGNDLVVRAYQPLDDSSLNYIRQLTQHIDRMTGELIGPNKLRYAQGYSDSTGQYYRAEAGQSYLSYWQHGLGLAHNGEEIPNWREQTTLTPISDLDLGTQLMVNEFFNQPNFCFATYFQQQADMNNATLDQTAESQSAIKLKFISCLLGGAIGDAFGAPVEFMSRKAILQKYGSNGITDFDIAYGRKGAITDDTQMTLFTAEGLIRAWVRSRFKGGTSELSCIGHAYQRWYQTQGYGSLNHLCTEMTGYLSQQKELFSQRAPGNTCLDALPLMDSFESPAINDSKGCGGVMRVAPIGLYCWRLKQHFSLHECFKLASDAAQLTHGHPTGYLASGAFAAIIYQLVDGKQLVDACDLTLEILRTYDAHQETTNAIKQALKLANSQEPPHQAIAAIGEGWIAEEALAVAIYCVLVAPTFAELMTISVSHNGDSDSTGAIAGNLWGASYGQLACNNQWIDELELSSNIAELAEDLFYFPDWDIGELAENQEFSNAIWGKYPGH